MDCMAMIAAALNGGDSTPADGNSAPCSWIGTVCCGLARSWVGLARFSKTDGMTIFQKVDGLDDDGVQAFMKTAEGSLWVGTGGGLDSFPT